MRNILFSILTLALISSSAQAQTAADQASIKAFWKQTWQAYQSGEMDKVLPLYADNASSITPDGRVQNGKEAIKADWEAFTAMTDAKPTFTYEEPAIRFITPDVAITTYSTDVDIKIGGQQMGGRMTGVAIVRKVKGSWLIELDSMTPVMEMPEATGK